MRKVKKNELKVIEGILKGGINQLSGVVSVIGGSSGAGRRENCVPINNLKVHATRSTPKRTLIAPPHPMTVLSEK